MGNKSTSDMADHKSEPANKQVTKRPPHLMVIIFMLMDTAWRVAVPILILSIIGHQIDLHYSTGPLYLFVGFFLSLIVAISLVYRQLVVAFPDQFGKNRHRYNGSSSTPKASFKTGDK